MHRRLALSAPLQQGRCACRPWSVLIIIIIIIIIIISHMTTTTNNNDNNKNDSTTTNKNDNNLLRMYARMYAVRARAHTHTLRSAAVATTSSCCRCNVCVKHTH